MISLRGAAWGDARRIYEWRNDPETRRWSFQDQPIPWESHLVWLKETLSRDDVRFWIASTEADGDVGEIRFGPGKAPGEAKVHVLVGPSFRGRGFGAQIIETGTDRFFRETSIQRIRAEILSENTASRSAFLRAGYRWEGVLPSGLGDIWVRPRRQEPLQTGP